MSNISTTWTGGSVGNTNDWDDDQNWSEGVPQTGWVAIISIPAIITTGITAHTDHLSKLLISGSAVIGSASTPLTIGADLVQWTGKGAYVKIAANASGIQKLIAAPTGNGTFYTCSGEFARIEGGTNGRIEIDSDAEVVRVFSAGAGLYIAQGASEITEIVAAGGSHISRRDIDTLTVGAAAVVELQESASIATKVFNHGRYVHQSQGWIADIETYPNAVSTAADSPYPFTVQAMTNWPLSYSFTQETASAQVTLPSTPSTVAYATITAEA